MAEVDPQTIRDFVEERLLGGETVETDEDLMVSGRIDSLGVMTLVSHLEILGGRPVPAQDVTLENFRTIDAMAAYLNGR